MRNKSKLTILVPQITDLAAYIEASETQAGTGQAGDWLSGDNGNDTLVGDTGNDVLLGGEGKDIVFGGAGDGYLEGDGEWRLAA